MSSASQNASPLPPPTPIPLNQPSTTLPVPFELVNAVVFGFLDKTKPLSSTNNAAEDPDFLPSELFCGEPVLEPGVLGFRRGVLILVGVEYNNGFGLDGVVVDEFSVLSEILDGGVDVIEEEFNFALD